MFEYFPGNYVWNLGVVAALNSGGLIDEVAAPAGRSGRPPARGEDAGTPDFLRAWTALTDQLADQAEAATKAGHNRSAAQLYARATNYLCQAERMLSNRTPPDPHLAPRAGPAGEGVRRPGHPRGDPVRGHDPARVLQPGARR